MPISLVAPPTEEPVTLVEAKAHLKVEISNDDDLIGELISAIRIECENELRRSLMTQTLELVLDAFEPVLFLRLPPVQSVSSVKYLDASGAQQTLDTSLYVVDTDSEPARVVPAVGKAWPATQRNAINAIRVRFVAGYANAAAVPASIKLWIKLRLTAAYENRSQVIAETRVTVSALPYVDTLLDRYRLNQLF